MRSTRTATLILGMLAAVATPSYAGKAFSTPALPGNINGSNDYICGAVNNGTKPVEVTLEIVDTVSGLVLTVAGPTTLDPDKRAGVSLSGANQPTVSTFCRVSGLSSKKGSLSYFARDASDNMLMWMTAP